MLASSSFLNRSFDGSQNSLRFAFIAQVALYAAAIAGLVRERRKLKLGQLAYPYYFALANTASFVAFWKAVRGETYVVWEPIRDARDANSAPETLVVSDTKQYRAHKQAVNG